MPELGRAALVAAFGLILYAAVVGGYAAWRGRRRLLDSATNALFAAFAAVGVASLVLLAALAGRDFSFDYVARSTSRELPLSYTLAAFWSGQEGSLLLWLLVLTGAASAAVALNRRLVREVLPWTVPIVAGVALFFAFLLVVIASPFAIQAAPADGAGMNPSLQNPYMIAHPPMLYLGYVGPDDSVRLRHGRARLAARGRTLDRGHAALDARGLDIPRRRHPPRREVGLRGGGVGRLVRLGSRRERRAHALARRHGVPPLGDGAGEEEHAPRLERHPRRRSLRALALWDVPDQKRCDQLDPQLHPVVDRPVLPRVHRGRGGVLDRADPLPPAAPALADEARVARLPRGRVSLQQPLPRRARAHDPLGRGLPVGLGGCARRRRLGGRAVLRLLCRCLRPAPRAADGDRARGRLAACFASVARLAAGLAGGRRARRRRAAPHRRSGLEPGRPRRLHIRRVRADDDRARVRARHARTQVDRHRRLVAGFLRARGAEPTALRRLHRPRRDRRPPDRGSGDRWVLDHSRGASRAQASR